MRIRKTQAALSALTAAGLAAWAGAPAAHGDFVVTLVDMGVQTQNALQSPQGAGQFHVWVLEATNEGTGAGQVVNTGSTLEVVQTIIDTGDPSTFGSTVNAISIDVLETTIVGGTKASNSKFSANVNGAIPVPWGQNFQNNGGSPPAPPAEFGDVAGGTFVGIGTGPFTTDLVNNPVLTQDAANSPGSKGGTAAVYTNSQTSDYVLSGNTAANYLAATSPNLDPPIKNGTVHSLEVDTVSEDSSGNVLPVADDPANGPVPFANIVVPASVTSFTIHGGLAGDAGGTQAFSTIVGGSPPPPSLVLKITATSGAGGTNIGTATVVGSNGSYKPATVSVPGGQAQTGNLTIAGFAPASDQEIVGLDAVGANSLTQLFTDLQAALQATNPGATVFAPTGSAGAILTAASDNVEILLPSGSLPGVMPESLSYDTSGYSGNGSVTLSNITVLPEPTAIGAIALGGLGLLKRRRRRTLG